MKRMKKVMAMLLTLIMVGGLLSGCGGGSKGASITLTVYSQLANQSGEMQGWFAQILKDRWDVKVNLIADSEGVYETRMEAGDLGDLVIWGSDGKQYLQAVEAGLLLDWEEDNILAEYGSNILENMSYALEKNREISGTGKIYGFGHNVASSAESHEAFMYSWEIRWDLYEQLGHPAVKNLNDLISVFEQMKEICPTDDQGKPTYAMSIWPDWDGNYVMYVKSMATAYYGYDEFGFGHYDPDTGKYYDALAEGSPYLEMLEFFNQLYRKGLLDPDSMTQTYDQMSEKMTRGGVFLTIFDYANTFNNDTHYAENQIMKPLVPEEATPIVYGMSVYGGNRVWSIGAKSQYPELCMEIIDWLTTPEGRLTMDYGPKGVCWDYDENGKTYLTEFGLQCYEQRNDIIMPPEWGGATFNDGSFQINNTTWSQSDINPESGETYKYETWASAQLPEGHCAAELDWREFNGCTTVEEYMEARNYRVDIATTFAEGKRDSELDTVWQQVATCLKDYSWQAIYATSDEEFDAIVSQMKELAMSYGYDRCVAWSQEEANRLNELQAPLRGN